MFQESIFIRGDVFRPQTRRFGEITMLYTQLIAKKSGVHWVRGVGEQVLNQSKYSVERNKAIVSTLRTQFTPNFSSASSRAFNEKRILGRIQVQNSEGS
jgi:hypothetical protein